MNILFDTFALTNASVESIDFFRDFIAFIQRLQNRPIKRTPTGNISLKDIEPLLKGLKTTREAIKMYRKYHWKLRTEQELGTLEQIKILAEVMRLTYKRKGKILLSKNGREFLNDLSPIHQYKQMALHYWHNVNWDYFSYTKNVEGITINHVLQDNQDQIWYTLLCKDRQWINYQKFCLALRDYFYLETFFEDNIFEPEKQLFTDIENSLFRKNLRLFNCVEMEKNRFRSTHVGLYLYQKALYEKYV